MPFLAFYFLEKKVFPLLKSDIKAVSMKKELFLFSFPLVFSGIAGMITTWTDTLMLGYFCTASDVGISDTALWNRGGSNCNLLFAHIWSDFQFWCCLPPD